jgi:serine/threonine protein kinase
MEDKNVNFKSFNIIRTLGSGAFGKVFLVEKIDTKKIYAMKALKKRNLILKR